MTFALFAIKKGSAESATRCEMLLPQCVEFRLRQLRIDDPDETDCVLVWDALGN